MRKNELIELLNSIDGNPEVFLWNSCVGDIQPLIKLNKDVLQKTKVEYFLKLLNLEEKESGKSPSTLDDAKRLLKKMHWERNKFISLDDKNHRKKSIVVLEPGEAGKTSWDRLGSIKY
jgi:hypothetical protein